MERLYISMAKTVETHKNKSHKLFTLQGIVSCKKLTRLSVAESADERQRWRDRQLRRPYTFLRDLEIVEKFRFFKVIFYSRRCDANKTSFESIKRDDDLVRTFFGQKHQRETTPRLRMNAFFFKFTLSTD